MEVLAGAFLAIIPGLPAVELDPELVLLLVLPPILYTSAVSMSWSEFGFNLRPITLLAFVCVVFTTLAVAADTVVTITGTYGVSQTATITVLATPGGPTAPAVDIALGGVPATV